MVMDYIILAYSYNLFLYEEVGRLRSEDYYRYNIKGLILILKQDDNNNSFAHRDYIIEKLDLVLSGNGINLHPSIKELLLNYGNKVKRKLPSTIEPSREEWEKIKKSPEAYEYFQCIKRILKEAEKTKL